MATVEVLLLRCLALGRRCFHWKRRQRRLALAVRANQYSGQLFHNGFPFTLRQRGRPSWVYRGVVAGQGEQVSGNGWNCKAKYRNELPYLEAPIASKPTWKYEVFERQKNYVPPPISRTHQSGIPMRLNEECENNREKRKRRERGIATSRDCQFEHWPKVPGCLLWAGRSSCRVRES